MNRIEDKGLAAASFYSIRLDVWLFCAALSTVANSVCLRRIGDRTSSARQVMSTKQCYRSPVKSRGGVRRLLFYDRFVIDSDWKFRPSTITCPKMDACAV